MASNIQRIFLPAGKNLQELLAEKESRLMQLRTQYEKRQIEGINNFIRNIEPLNLFIYFIFVQVIVLLFGIIPIQLNHTIGLFLGMLFIYIYEQNRQSYSIQKFSELEIKMEKIQPKPKYFWVDANIIELVYNIKEYYTYNPKAFTEMVNAIDNIFKIELDTEKVALDRCKANSDIAIDQYNLALNNLHSILYTLPTTSISTFISDKLIDAQKKLQLYLQRHLDNIAHTCNVELDYKGLDISSRYVETDQPIGIDITKNNRFHIY